MKKSELKNIIKECVKEVIFEEGVLSGIITEVMQGLNRAPLNEASYSRPSQSSQQIKQAKREVLSSIGKNAYQDAKRNLPNPELFEGTKPIPNGSGRGGALTGVDPGDSGVDISNIPGMGRWATAAFGDNQ